MRLAFVRHGEPAGSVPDPPLTSAGRRMASETGRWLRERSFRPVIALVTATARTGETAEEVLASLSEAPPIELCDLPEEERAWAPFVHALSLRVLREADVLLVGHHPTQDFLLRTFGPANAPIPKNHRAAAIVLVSEPEWRVSEVWPGRPCL